MIVILVGLVAAATAAPINAPARRPLVKLHLEATRAATTLLKLKGAPSNALAKAVVKKRGPQRVVVFIPAVRIEIAEFVFDLGPVRRVRSKSAQRGSVVILSLRVPSKSATVTVHRNGALRIDGVTQVPTRQDVLGSRRRTGAPPVAYLRPAVADARVGHRIP